MVSATVKQQCHMLDSSPKGISTVNSKKARGLMRAGGEAAKTLYTDWPHDFVLVGLENHQVFYKDFNFQQWGYGYVSILERQTDPLIREDMITHLKNTYLDAINYGFKRAKCVHAKILNDIQEGIIRGVMGQPSRMRAIHISSAHSPWKRSKKGGRMKNRKNI
jgi:hypothetical protein